MWEWAEEVLERKSRTFQDIEKTDVVGNVPKDFLCKTIENVEVTLQESIVNEGVYVEVLFVFH